MKLVVSRVRLVVSAILIIPSLAVEALRAPSLHELGE